MPAISDIDYEPLGGINSQDIYDDGSQEVLCHIEAYKSSVVKNVFYHIFSIIFLGIPYLIFTFYPKIGCLMKYNSCRIDDADKLLVRDNHNNYTIENMSSQYLCSHYLQMDLRINFFSHQQTKYIWVIDQQSFQPVNKFIENKRTCTDLANADVSLSDLDSFELFEFFGPNKIEIEVKSYWRLFIEEILNPFYFFQAFSVILWCTDDYYIYAGCVVLLTLLSSITSLIQVRKQSKKLHDIVESSKCHEVTVIRGCEEKTINPEQVVPGDLIVLPAVDYIMPCDAVLITGQCIVNESILTGESAPVTITQLPDDSEIYNINVHKRHTLFSGTHVLQTRYYTGRSVLARVVRTGFYTTKGQLVKSILYPVPVNLKFYSDAFKFIYVLFFIALSGMIYSLYLYITREASYIDTIIRTLDIITIVVPPALPAAMAVGTAYSQSRLKLKKIFCVSPPRINVCGKIKLACFDKTGTLTQEGLNMHSVHPCDVTFCEPITDSEQLWEYGILVRGMASCHSLTRIDGELKGDSLDLSMFEYSRWIMEEPDAEENARYDMIAPTMVKPLDRILIFNDAQLEVPRSTLEHMAKQDYLVGIIQTFPFSSSAQCMSVICRDLINPTMFSYTKGAPEKIFGLCNPESLPDNFHDMLSSYTSSGLRVIAMAYKKLPASLRWIDTQKIKRDMIECDLQFLGFIIMENKLKDATAPVIKQLHNAEIRTVMITGDYIMTAISVARECGMVNSYHDIYILGLTECENDIIGPPQLTLQKAGGTELTAMNNELSTQTSHFAIDGKIWTALKLYYPHLLPGLLVRTKIFARFQPDQKTQVVTALQDLDYVVAMVGDGANDCGALRAAYVGVSLSPAEASVAAPFTSGLPDISCLLYLMAEGRCALVTSFGLFKYMAVYSLIQFMTVLILYRCFSTLGDFQFLYIDLVVTTVLALTMGLQGPVNSLCRRRPMSSLVSPKNLLPLFLHIFLCGLVQLGALVFLYQQPWFIPISPSKHDEEVILSWENTVLFIVSSYQYIIMAWHFSKGWPYRQSSFCNCKFFQSVILLTAFTTWMLLAPCKKMSDIMELINTSEDPEKYHFQLQLLAFPALHFVVGAWIEFFVGERTWVKRLFQCIRRKRHPKNKYKMLLADDSFMREMNLLQVQT